MSCLECKHSNVNRNRVVCSLHRPLDVQDFHLPETCRDGEREDNAFGKRFGMRSLLLAILKSTGKSLSDEDYSHILHQQSVSHLLLSSFALYERKLKERGIPAPESNELGTGRACLSCSHASIDEHHLNLRCSHYQKPISPLDKGCDTPTSVLKDHLIRENGLANMLDFLLIHESTLLLFLHDEWTAGEKWLLILSTYEETLKTNRHKLVRPRKERLQNIGKTNHIEDDIVH